MLTSLCTSRLRSWACSKQALCDQEERNPQAVDVAYKIQTVLLWVPACVPMQRKMCSANADALIPGFVS